MLSRKLIFAALFAGLLTGDSFAATTAPGSQPKGTQVGGQHDQSDNQGMSRKPRGQRVRECKAVAHGDLVACTNSCYGIKPDKSGNRDIDGCRDFCDFVYDTDVAACNRMR